MIRKRTPLLSILALTFCTATQAQDYSKPKCDDLLSELLNKPVSYVGVEPPPTIIDDPTEFAPEPERSADYSPRYYNVGAQWSHGVGRLRLLHNVDGSRSAVGVFDEVAVFRDHYQFLDERRGSSRVWLGLFGDSATCKPNGTSVPGSHCYGQHATHVAGTIASAGRRDPNAESGLRPEDSMGMAPRAQIYSFDWQKDALKLCHAASGDDKIPAIYVSNHSYGPSLGWKFDCDRWDNLNKCSEARWTWLLPNSKLLQDDRFGDYGLPSRNGTAEDFDNLVYSRRNLSVFMSAGNHRDQDPTKADWTAPGVQSTYFWSDHVKFSASEERNLPIVPDYGLVSGPALAKNVITIGAIEKIDEDRPRPGSGDIEQDFENSDPEKITPDKLKVTKFSSWGPRSDGAIKPDLVAAGLSLISPAISDKQISFNKVTSKDEHYYMRMDGTSMATPVATGIGALLNEISFRKMRRALRADEMKAVLIHTAFNNSKNDIDNDAPNYATGWGAIRADYAGWLLDPQTAKANAKKPNRKHWIDVYERTFPGGFLLAQSEAKIDSKMFLEHIPGADVRVTLVWLDKPGPGLVDDLDLVVNGPAPTSTQHKVWCLSKTVPPKAAYQCDHNAIDNVERVDVKAGVEPNEGTWTIEVKHVRGPNKTIPFALVVSGLRRRGPQPPPQTIPPDLPPNGPIGEPPTIPQEPSRYCHACRDLPLRDAPYEGSPSRINVWKCDPVHIVGYDPSRPSWVKVTFEFPPFRSMGGFPGFSPGGPVPWNRGWAKRSEIACRGDGHWCSCDW